MQSTVGTNNIDIDYMERCTNKEGTGKQDTGRRENLGTLGRHVHLKDWPRHKNEQTTEPGHSRNWKTARKTLVGTIDAREADTSHGSWADCIDEVQHTPKALLVRIKNSSGHSSGVSAQITTIWRQDRSARLQEN